MARIVLGPRMNIQAPPNLNPGMTADLIAAGINDWGGVSPVTPDHVNPEAPWPAIEQLRAETAQAGKCLVERLAIYPGLCARSEALARSGIAYAGAARHRRRRFRARRPQWAPGLRDNDFRFRQALRADHDPRSD